MSKEHINADLCVIGAGAAGLVSSAGAALLARKVVLFEAGEMGGDCLNYGCVPSKAILTAAHVAHTVNTAARYGVETTPARIDFAKVREHIRAAIEAIHPNDSQERFEGMGVRVVRERARFTGPDTVESDSVAVRARRIVIASGTRARVLPIPGLSEAPYLTNETIWSLEALPEHLMILGGGPIGMELGQAFRRLGARVTILEASKPLARLEPEYAERVVEALRADGVDIRTDTRVERVESAGGAITLQLAGGETVSGSHLLVAAGREPVVDALDLDKAGVRADERGIVCDDKLRTDNKRVYAAGDIAGKGQLTHLAGWHGSVIVRQLYYGLPTKQSSAAIPQAVYTDPCVAGIGLSEAEARERFGDAVSVARWGFDDNDRAIAEGRTEGGVKLVIGKGAKLLGVHAAGDRADDLVQIGAQVLAKGGTVRDLTSTVPAYPTRGEILKRAAGKHYEPVVFGPFAKFLAALLTRFH